MQRYSLWFLLLATLYVSGCTTASRGKPAPVSELPAAVLVPPVAPVDPAMSVLTPSTVDMTALPTSMPPLPPAVDYAPHIAIILPLKNTMFAAAAEAVRLGFMTAASSQVRDFPVRVYNSVDESRDVVEIYRQAQANGALAVAGPLTRSGVTLLAAYPYITVPTLAMNTSEQLPVSSKLYFFGLIPETEARQIAQLAFAAKLRDATIINTGTPLSKRISTAFAEEWKKLGGNVTAEVLYKDGDDSSVLINLPTAAWLVDPVPVVPLITEANAADVTAPKRPGPPPVAPGNVAFIAGDTRQTRLIRPYLNPSLPVYGTSQLFNLNSDTLTNYDLNDIRFVDMPWLLQPDHPAVMVYPKATAINDTDKERLYAFGIDSYRLLNILLKNRLQVALPLDGVTGRIKLAEGNVFQRDATPALFRYGRGFTPSGLAAYETERAAAKAADFAARRAATLENSALTQPAK